MLVVSECFLLRPGAPNLRLERSQVGNHTSYFLLAQSTLNNADYLRFDLGSKARTV